MAGLREKQKADRERRILAAAVMQFRENGYRSVRMEDLAEMAEVSVATVYNYYQSKGDILIATVAMEVQEVLEAGVAIVKDPPNGVDNAIFALVYQYYDHSLNYLSKEMWRKAMALSIEAPSTPNGKRYNDLDARLAQQVMDLVITLQARGEIREDMDAGALGQLVFNNLNMMFIEFIKNNDMTAEALKAQFATQIRPLAHLIATDGLG